jgi:hypothetical protein
MGDGCREPTDVVRTTLALPVLLGERVVDLLRSSGFTGWRLVPVELRHKAGDVLSTYHYLCVHGRCGAIDDSRSERMEKRFPGGVFPVLKGLYFDPATWDGSDIFIADRRRRVVRVRTG